jgi:soluble lytic murein transglycosylase-like protein
MAVLEEINNAIIWLEKAKKSLELQAEPQETTPVVDSPSIERKVAWGAKVSPVFKARILWTAEALGCDPNDLMACIAWESGETFRADIKNAAGSGATGLIQFMPSTARGLGTTTALLAKMTPEDQIRSVYEYF